MQVKLAVSCHRGLRGGGGAGVLLWPREPDGDAGCIQSRARADLPGEVRHPNLCLPVQRPPIRAQLASRTWAPQGRQVSAGAAGFRFSMGCSSFSLFFSSFFTQPKSFFFSDKMRVAIC